MDDRDRAIRAVNGAQERQHDMWSPPSVITRRWCFPSFEIDTSGVPMSESFGGAENGMQCSRSRWPSSICWIAYALSYGITGMAPQSTSLSLDKNGFTSNGTLYPPYNVRHHDPERMPAGPKRAPACTKCRYHVKSDMTNRQCAAWGGNMCLKLTKGVGEALDPRQFRKCREDCICRDWYESDASKICARVHVSCLANGTGIPPGIRACTHTHTHDGFIPFHKGMGTGMGTWVMGIPMGILSTNSNVVELAAI